MHVNLVRDKRESLLQHMVDVIGAYKNNLRSPGQTSRELTIRWDADVFPSSIHPLDSYAKRILDCLKYFEAFSIEQRHMNSEVVDDFVAYCNSHGHSVKLIQLENSETGPKTGDRNARCEMKFDNFTFKYSNNDFLPTLTVKAEGGRWFW